MRPIRTTRIAVEPDNTISVALHYDGISIQALTLKREEWHEVIEALAHILIETASTNLDAN